MKKRKRNKFWISPFAFSFVRSAKLPSWANLCLYTCENKTKQHTLSADHDIALKHTYEKFERVRTNQQQTKKTTKESSSARKTRNTRGTKIKPNFFGCIFWIPQTFSLKEKKKKNKNPRSYETPSFCKKVENQIPNPVLSNLPILRPLFVHFFSLYTF